MNSRWGFDLDMSAVRLMRREGGHWREIAREKIDGPDIEDRLMAMVDKIEPRSPVYLFLPRDQILYTDVKVGSEDAGEDEIAAAMDGRTPYTLDELELDWVVTDPETARVAAIAKETLDEAAAFAEVRGLTVAGYSSLAEPEDFPRPPVFGGADVGVPDAADETAPEDPQADVERAVAFHTIREPRASEILTLTNPQATPDTPVLRVDDATPVMQVQTRLPPLDPGQPLDKTPTAPRVRTDIAAGTLSGAAASLFPAGPSIKVRARRSKPLHTAAVFVVAAIMTIGIAAIVWSILPLAPSGTTARPTEATETGTATQSGDPVDSVASVAPVPDLPQPDTWIEAAALENVTASDDPPDFSPLATPSVQRTETAMPLANLPDRGLLPQTTQPLERSPDSLAEILSDDPVQGLDGSEDSAESTLDIYLASIERRDLAFDAIALPPASSLGAASLPVVTPPPSTPDDTVELATVDPTVIPSPDTQPETAEGETSEQVSSEETPASELRPTELAAALPDRAPRARPGDFTARLERQQFGGLTRSELAGIAPKARPQSAKIVAQAEREPQADASELAVDTSRTPRTRPQDFDAIVAAAIVNARAQELTASVEFDTPDTSAAIEAALADDAEPEPRPQDTPRLAIPSSASVSRQATIENAIPLNKINLVGVYGVPSDRRALIRLPSGRYVKVKVGDRVDGGTVAQIGDSELIYRKGSRTLSLSMPKG